MSTKTLLTLNKLFPRPEHPFNLQNDGVETYAMWQYKRGADTIKFFTEKYSEDEMFRDKVVLDIGCGAGGKTMYYASKGAKEVIGMDIVEHYKADSEALAAELGFSDVFRFICRDASDTGLPENSIDTVIMNDAVEHVSEPEKVIAEVARILKPGGRLYANFPPYGHPYGAHLSDLIGIPWVQCLFSEKTQIAAYKELCKTVPDGAERIAFRFSTDENGEEYYSYINHMTLKRFYKIRDNAPIKAEYYREIPLRSFLKPLAKAPFFKEYFVKMAVCVFKK